MSFDLEDFSRRLDKVHPHESMIEVARVNLNELVRLAKETKALRTRLADAIARNTQLLRDFHAEIHDGQSESAHDVIQRLVREKQEAQARAERAEGEIKLLRVAFAEASHNDCQAGIEIDALKKQLSPTSPQGRTDGEPWQISRAVDALEWAFSAVLLAEPRYANTESYQIHEATLNGLRSMIGKPVTAPEVKGGAA